MNWLERYVGAVKNYLPRKIREDVGEEIMSGMRDKLEAKEDQLGRKLKESELKKWIGGQAHPMVVASGYQKRRELVSAELFPLYLYALKIALVIILVLKVLGIGFYIFGNNEFHISGMIVRLFSGLLENALLAFASITLVFHFLGEQFSASKFFEKWSVDNLPQTGHKWIAVPVGEMIFEIVIYLFALGLVNSFYFNQWDFWWSDRLSLNPAIYGIVPWFNAVIVLFLVHRIWLVARPHWNTAKLVTDAALGVFGLWVLVMILSLDPIVSFDPAFVTDHPEIDRQIWVNRIVTYSLYFVGLSYLYELGRDLYRIYKLKS